jgi:hypothetical protein
VYTKLERLRVGGTPSSGSTLPSRRRRLAGALALAALLGAGASHASHFRFGHLTWERVGETRTVEITFIAAFRRSGFFSWIDRTTGGPRACTGGGFPAVGDVIREDVGATRITGFGDGTAATPTLHFEVFSIDIGADWLLGRALDPADLTRAGVSHTYADGLAGPFVVESSSCCRVGTSGGSCHVNNPDANYRVSTVVEIAAAASPIALLPPLVDCPAVPRDDGRFDVDCSFRVSAVDPSQADPERPALSWCLATPAEMFMTGVAAVARGAR